MNFFSTLRNQRETALIGAAAIVLLALTAYSSWLTERGFNDAEIAGRLNRFNAKLTDFAQMLRIVKSSERGYLITSSPEFLQRYNEMSGRLMPLAQELQVDAPKELASAQRISAIFQPLSAKLKEMAETIALERAGRRDLAVERVKGGFGRNLTDFIEAEAASIEADGNASELRHFPDGGFACAFLEGSKRAADVNSILILLDLNLPDVSGLDVINYFQIRCSTQACSCYYNYGDRRRVRSQEML
ncbi:MAG TPA: CHASE3 domain-containing protein [Hyphomicrobiales bacterium]|nr:CHASE3 domain-containing protein [Hyphomicrobiales bacterium]